MHNSIFIAIQKSHKSTANCQLYKPQSAKFGQTLALQRFSTAWVYQIITGDDGEVDYVFPSSEDSVSLITGAVELHNTDEFQGER